MKCYWRIFLLLLMIGRKVFSLNLSRLSLHEHKESGAIGAVFIKLKSLSIHPIKVYVHVDNNDKNEKIWKLQGFLNPGGTTSLGGFVGQRLKYVIQDKEINSFIIEKEKVLYALEDETTTNEMKLEIQNENDFSIEYKKKNNRPWIGYFGVYGSSTPKASARKPPSLFMYDALKAGDIYTKDSTAYKWINDKEVKKESTYNIEVLSTAPKVFVIKDFLSDFEVDMIIKEASSLLKQSEVGSDSYGGTEYDSVQRSSTSCWLPRATNYITESIYCRAADILGIAREKMCEKSHAESMQVVHYDTNQRFNCHYDFTIDNEPSYRFLTLLIYLNDQLDKDSGGETAFPKSHSTLGLKDNDETTGFKIHAGKGSAILFYNQLQDGNGDYLSLHSGLPVLKGEKWAANIWVWA